MLKNSVYPELGQENWSVSTTFAAFTGCHCLGTHRGQIPRHMIKKIEIVPISGHCRRPEIMWVRVCFLIHEMSPVLYPVPRTHSRDTFLGRLTRRNGSKICINPNQAWFKLLLRQMQKWFYLTLNENNDSISLCTRFRVINCVFYCSAEVGRGPVPPLLPSRSDFLPGTAVTLRSHFLLGAVLGAPLLIWEFKRSD